MVARPDDPVAAAAALARLLDDADRRRRQGAAARRAGRGTVLLRPAGRRPGRRPSPPPPPRPTAAARRRSTTAGSPDDAASTGDRRSSGPSWWGDRRLRRRWRWRPPSPPTPSAAPPLVLDVALFAAGCVLFAVAFLRAADRSRTDAIGIGGLFFLAGDVAPPAVRRRLLGALAVQTVVGLATAGVRLYTNLAAGTLVPVFGLGLCGLWAARHGRFGPRTRRPPDARRRPRIGSGP